MVVFDCSMPWRFNYMRQESSIYTYTSANIRQTVDFPCCVRKDAERTRRFGPFGLRQIPSDSVQDRGLGRVIFQVFQDAQSFACCQLDLLFVRQGRDEAAGFDVGAHKTGDSIIRAVG